MTPEDRPAPRAEMGSEPLCILSWNGFNLYGDSKSIERAGAMLHDSEEVVPALRAHIAATSVTPQKNSDSRARDLLLRIRQDDFLSDTARHQIDCLLYEPAPPPADSAREGMEFYAESSIALNAPPPAAEIVGVTDAAKTALDAYEDRFESTTGNGNYLGPIDEEMKALRAALAGQAKSAGGGETCIRWVDKWNFKHVVSVSAASRMFKAYYDRWPDGLEEIEATLRNAGVHIPAAPAQTEGDAS